MSIYPYLTVTNEFLNAINLCKELKNHGFKSYLAGGCVRDMILNVIPKDYDIATNATIPELKTIFPNSHDVGINFGVILVNIDGVNYEIATFRSDGEYTDGRHPSSYKIANEESDAWRRDFTINGLFYDPFSGKIIDYVGGMLDIKTNCIRAIGNPVDRFKEDNLRLIRAIRFAGINSSYTIDDYTYGAISENSELILNVSVERLYSELSKILVLPTNLKIFVLLHNTGLLEHILPEIDNLWGLKQPQEYHPEGDAFTHTTLMIKRGAEQKLPLVVLYATLLHDIGKTKTQIITNDRIMFPNHDLVGSEMACNVCKRLKMSNEFTDEICWLVKQHMNMHHFQDMKKSKQKRLMYNPWFKDLLELYILDIGFRLKEEDVQNLNYINSEYKKLMENGEEEIHIIKPEPLVNGNDLISLGFTPGVIFKRILTEVEDLFLEGNLKTKDEAIQYIQNNFKTN